MALLRSLSGVVVLALATACGGGGGGGSSVPPIAVTSLAAAGPGSLAEAVATAPPGATITFAPGVTGTIGLGGGGLVIGKPLTIQGPAGGGLTLSGEGTARVMEVTPAGSATLSDLEIVDGGSGGDDGAGIRNAGTISLTRVQVRNCATGGVGRGGGIYNFGATATLTDCTIEGCSGYNGGGFANDGGVMTLRRCLVTGNATSGNVGGGGLSSDGTVVLVNCTFHANQTTGAGRDGGGLAIFVPFSGADTTILSCTFTNNVATGAGGGIYSAGDPARLSALRIESSIIAGNTSGSGGPDCDFTTPGITFNTVRTNVIGIDLGSMIVNGVDGNQVGTVGVPIDPMLGALQDNGGPTLTRVPAAGSVARNAVPTIECVDEDGSLLEVDQRSFVRPVGGACDAGAVESP